MPEILATFAFLFPCQLLMLLLPKQLDAAQL
jgi:hypothetical protein